MVRSSGRSTLGGLDDRDWRSTMIRSFVLVVAAVVAVASVSTTGAAGANVRASVDPARFSGPVDNPWYPLRPGTTWIYRGSEGGEPSRDVMRVEARAKTIQGVRCVVVHDNVYLSGRLAERTLDWFAQDADGNVWYFGEATAELDANGRVRTTEGSWEAGVDGARAGIVMPAHPKVGQAFRQEYYRGHAEDHFGIVSLSSVVRVPFGSSVHALLTREWTPLQPGHVEHKFYVEGVGLVKDDSAVLVSMTRP
jgi:hypothetical protein